MTDTLKLKNGLVMPSNFIEVKDDEMEYVDGSGLIGNIFGTIGCALGAIGAICCGIASAAVPEPTGLTKLAAVGCFITAAGCISGIVAFWC